MRTNAIGSSDSNTADGRTGDDGERGEDAPDAVKYIGSHALTTYDVG